MKKILNNQDIRKLMKSKNISQYDLSVKMSVCEMTVFRMLRKKLSKEEKKKIIEIINEMEG